MSLNIEYLKKWIGRQEEKTDLVTEFPIAGLLALLNRPQPDFADNLIKIPLASHWLYFLPRYSQFEIGADGHKIKGEFLPPVELPRRMWAGGRLEFKGRFKIGDEIRRVSSIKNVKHIKGETGDLVFVVVGHSISNSKEVIVEEDHNIVYRAPSDSNSVKKRKIPVPGVPQWSKVIEPDPVLLFRYSALTFNSHRIHYDRDYVTKIEGYPGLLVHGPLLATLLLDFFESEMPSCELLSFDYRIVSPLYDVANFTLNGMITRTDMAKLWVADDRGGLSLLADVKFSSSKDI